MKIPLAVLLVLGIGALLTFSATRATENVRKARTFLRWMVVVFLAYLALITLPLIAGF